MRAVSRQARIAAQRAASSDDGRIDKTKCGDLWLDDMQRRARRGDADAAADLVAMLRSAARQYANATASHAPSKILGKQTEELPFAYTVETEWVPVRAMTATEARTTATGLERKGKSLLSRARKLLDLADLVDKHGTRSAGEALAAEGTPMVEGEVA